MKTITSLFKKESDARFSNGHPDPAFRLAYANDRCVYRAWGTGWRACLPAPARLAQCPPACARHEPCVCDSIRARNEGYRDNSVKTSKYTLWNFVPLFLFMQFSRRANAYFGIICILQTIPSISITSGVPTQIIPLSFVLFFDAILTAREDYKRHQDDAKANAMPALVHTGNGRFELTPWQDVRVGDVVKVSERAYTQPFANARESCVPLPLCPPLPPRPSPAGAAR